MNKSTICTDCCFFNSDNETCQLNRIQRWVDNGAKLDTVDGLTYINEICNAKRTKLWKEEQKRPILTVLSEIQPKFDVIIRDGANIRQCLDYLQQNKNIKDLLNVFITTHDYSDIVYSNDNVTVAWFAEEENINIDEYILSLRSKLTGTHLMIMDSVPNFSVGELINRFENEQLYKYRLYTGSVEVINTAVLITAMIAGWSYSQLINELQLKHQKHIYSW